MATPEDIQEIRSSAIAALATLAVVVAAWLLVWALTGTCAPAPDQVLPAPQPVAAQQGTWYPVARPWWVGQWVLGPVWVYVPHQPAPQFQPPHIPEAQP